MNIIDNSGTFKVSKPVVSGKGNGGAPAAAATGVSATKAPTASHATGAAGATTTASAQASAAQLMSTHGDFDAARVAEIRASISAGCYVVNTGRIADGLLASAQELLQSPQH